MCYRLVSIEHQVRSSIRHSWSRAFVRGLGRVVKFWKFYPWLKQCYENCYIFNKGQFILYRALLRVSSKLFIGNKVEQLSCLSVCMDRAGINSLVSNCCAIMSNILSSRLGFWFQLCFWSTYIYKKAVLSVKLPEKKVV